MTRDLAKISALVVALFACGCAGSYVTPSRGAPMSAFGLESGLIEQRDNQTDFSISRRLDLKPLVRFPSSVAMVRVQAPYYVSASTRGYGRGAYSVVFAREVEKEEHFEKIVRLSRIDDVAMLNRMVIPSDLQSDRELREAAASLHADLLLLYTLDTTFHTDDAFVPLTVFTLGLFPSQNARVVTTASAALMDTRNGYIYCVVEATKKTNQIANAWTSSQAVEDSRRRAESAAFDVMVDRFVSAWPTVLARYDGATRPASTSIPGGVRYFTSDER